MERVVERANMRLAYQRVVRNKGAAGVDDLTVAELKGWLAVHWPSVKKALLEGRYLPRAVRRVDIAKPSGGVSPSCSISTAIGAPSSSKVVISVSLPVM